MTHKKINERRLTAALNNRHHKATKRHAAVEASKLNQCVRDTSVDDLGLHFECLKLDFEVLKLPFEGEVNIPTTKEIAKKLATEASGAAFDPSNRFFFACCPIISDKTQESQASSEADVEAGLIAISRCLSLVTSDLLRASDKQRLPKITILTHCQDALRRLDGARNSGSIARQQCRGRSISTSHSIDSTNQQVQATPALVDVVKKSRFLRRKLGVKLELQWLPRHATAERQRLAEAAQTTPALAMPETLPSLQGLRRAQNLEPRHRAYLRHELAHARRACRGGPPLLAQQSSSASSSVEEGQAESRQLFFENFSRLRISGDGYSAAC